MFGAGGKDHLESSGNNQLSQREIVNNLDWYIRVLRYRYLGGCRSLHSAGLQCDGLQFLSPEAFALNIEYCSIVKDPV